MTKENSGCGKFIAILGVVASIIAIFTFLTGIVSIKDLTGTSQHPTDNPPPTDYQQIQTEAPPITDIPQPVNTIAFVPTTISTEVSLPDTSPGTILEFGQTWRQGGLELTITKSDWAEIDSSWINEGGGVFTFILTNLEPHDRSFRLSSENFSATDNFGRSVPVIPKQNISIDEHCPPQTVQLPANQTIYLVDELHCPEAQAYALTPRIDAGDTSITDVVVSVSISEISNARWQIEIHH